MTSRERVREAINHEPPDRIPVDIDSGFVTGISVSTYGKLREALGFPRQPVKVWDPFQMLGEVDPEVRDALGIDVVGLERLLTMFGFMNVNWKPWRDFHGVQTLVSEQFVTSEDENGDILMHPRGDINAPPSGRMPKNGFYFDAIVRQQPIDWDNLDPEAWVRSRYFVYPEPYLEYVARQIDDYYRNTSLSLMGFCLGADFGNISVVPAVGTRKPRGISDPTDWYMAHVTHPEYIKATHDLMLEIALQNLRLYKQAVGDKIDVVFLSGSDFGAQHGPFISPKMYRELYKPYNKKVNDWVHENTNWKTFYHSCGSVVAFLDDFVEAGIDILNPVQTSAAGMDPVMLKEKYGDKIVFWGGGVDTQRVLPSGTPEEVREDVRRRLAVFGKGGGFVFAAIHNIQHGVPVENLLAMFDTLKEYGAEYSRP